MDKTQNKTTKKRREIIKKAIAMKCSQKDWDSIKGRIPKDMINDTKFDLIEYPYLTNNYFEKMVYGIGTHDDSMFRDYVEIYETFNAKIFLNACGIDCDVYEITKEQVLRIAERGIKESKLRQWFPDAFKKELEVEKGIWYKSETKFGSFKHIFKTDDGINFYGFINGVWFESDDIDKVTKRNLSEATPQEVEDALICEAKNREFKQGCTWRKGYFTAFDGDCFGYCFESNTLFFQGATIFENGIWEVVDIIETITIQEAEKLLNKKIV